MIARLTGRLASKAPDQVLLDVGGVGYLVHIPLSTFYELPEAESPASLWIHTHVREDVLALYGFLTERERSLFLLLMSVAGIGPRVALTVLSGIPPAELVEALRQQDVRRLVAIPGVGKKTAERMVLELRDKLDQFVAAPVKTTSPVEEDVLSALVNLGYQRTAVERALERLNHNPAASRKEAAFEELFRQTLDMLAK